LVAIGPRSPAFRGEYNQTDKKPSPTNRAGRISGSHEGIRRRPIVAVGDGRLLNQNQNGSAGGGVFPWNLAGTFPFGGPFNVGPFGA
jgi:hypothetical protein